MQKISVLGLGLMGSAIALRLKAQGFAVTGWNRSPEKAAALADQGIATAWTPADALAGADLTLLVLSDSEAIDETLFAGETAPALSGRALVQMGTIAPDHSRELAARVTAAGGEYLEAPVLGSLPEARDGRLIVMAGGEPDLFERCLPLLRALGQDPRLIGPVGKGAALKLAMNQLIAGLTATFSLSLGLVRAEGIDPEQFMGLLRTSALYAPTFDKKLDKYLSHAYGEANFPLRHLLKDVRLFRQVAERLGMDTAVVTTIEAACIRGVGQGYGEQDYSALYEALTAVRGRS
jgi:3-hydroxyisobutyrate dehydrogenase